MCSVEHIWILLQTQTLDYNKCKICEIQTIQFTTDVRLYTTANLMSFRVFGFEILLSLSIISFTKISED